MIRFEKATVSYPGPGKPALNQVSVDVDKGEFVFLVGASGSGKSTALKLVLREMRPTGGRVYVAGKEINRLATWKVPRLRRQIGTVFQDFRLLNTKTVAENVAFALQVTGRSGRDIRRLVPETLELVGLADKGARLPDELSGGEQQRVAIARAMVNQPMILIADEPTGNLDPASSAGIMTLLERINADGTTILMATHDHGLVDVARKRVVELDHGSVVRDEAAGAYGFQH
ncbi:cell division ATP-binding protein FtsE [Nocardioides sp. C4-1]|uniref:cell division ATP-binding protein FtsE n=1 Tax=Nocardioides sp. C4-1 TaxID=3151851 RepID=UPI003263445E